MASQQNGLTSKLAEEAETEERRYRLTLEYDGTDFFGWQLQPDQRTVQGVLEESLGQLFSASIRVHGAGRTDARVHALGQVAHFDAPARFEPEVIRDAVNHHLPADVRVLSVQPAKPDFHARFSARWRWYRYRIFSRQRALERQHGWWPGVQFDPRSLEQAAAAIVGEHDFSSFASADTETGNHLCRINVACWELGDDEWRFHIVADRFLRHMVRSLVGTMSDAARGRFSLDQFVEILNSRRKDHLVFTAPASGLCLMKVGYDLFPALDEDYPNVQTFPFEINPGATEEGSIS